MLTLPGLLLWLFLLFYFAFGQSLDITLLDTSNSSNKTLDGYIQASNETNAQYGKEKGNNTTEAPSEEKTKTLQNATLINFPNKTSHENEKTTTVTQLQHHPNRLSNQTKLTFNSTGIPMMSQERRNSYLSIAERRKYYNRTRGLTKKPDTEFKYQGYTTKPVEWSTETVNVNEIRVVTKPVHESSEIIENKNQTNNQRLHVSLSNNETSGKPLHTRQSVIESQYQFGQKLNLRKQTTRNQENLDEKIKRKKEKTETNSTTENDGASKLNTNYPTQSTKLLKVDKNLWATTVVPQMHDDHENFVTPPHENEPFLKISVENESIKNTSTVPDKLNPSSINVTESNMTLLNDRNITNESTFNKNITTGQKETVGDSLPLNNSNIQIHNSKQLENSNSSGMIKSNISSTTEKPLTPPETVETTKLVKLIVSTTPSYLRGRKVLNSNVTQKYGEIHQTTSPTVKPVFQESNTKQPSPETSVLRKNVKPNEKSNSSTKEEMENWSATEKYPLTIELNENNKRVLSEMFQSTATFKPSSTSPAPSTPKKDTISKADVSKATSRTTSLPSNSSTSKQTIPTPTTTPKDIYITNVVIPDEYEEEDDYNAQGTRYNTKFYVSPKINETRIIKVIEEEEVDEVDNHTQTAGVAIYVLAAFGLIPLLLALVFGAKFMMQRNQREFECESDAKSDISTNESQIKENRRRKGPTDLKKSPSNVTTITLVTGTRLPRVQHWENSDKQGNRNWEFPRSKLKLKTILGQGNFGQVWKADAEDMPGHEGMTRLVAVKTVKEGATEKEHAEFVKELEIMQQIGSHPNIVTLLGCCTDQEPYYLIMEYVKYGKLLTYLREHRINENYYNFSNSSDALTSRDLTVFAYCVARGMEYLASKGIIHRDLAARNVLVDHNKICKIADFGMSRSVRDFENGQVYEERQQKGALPIRWMAPESLVYSVFTYKSDVWSFGIVMWEIVTLGSTPYPNMGAREVMKKVRDGYRLERPSHCKPEFYRLISYCWAHDPNKRPDFSELRHELGNLLDNPTKDGSYVDLDRFAVDNSFPTACKMSDFKLLEKNDFRTLQKLGEWNNKDWPYNVKKFRMKGGRNDGKGTVTLTGQGSFTVNSRILEKEFKMI